MISEVYYVEAQSTKAPNLCKQIMEHANDNEKLWSKFTVLVVRIR